MSGHQIITAGHRQKLIEGETPPREQEFTPFAKWMMKLETVLVYALINIVN